MSAFGCQYLFQQRSTHPDRMFHAQHCLYGQLCWIMLHDHHIQKLLKSSFEQPLRIDSCHRVITVSCMVCKVAVVLISLTTLD